VIVPPRANTDLILDRNFITKQPAPYGDCLLDTTVNSSLSAQYFDYIVKKKVKPTQKSIAFPSAYNIRPKIIKIQFEMKEKTLWAGRSFRRLRIIN
jgi:hypothetical protein